MNKARVELQSLEAPVTELSAQEAEDTKGGIIAILIGLVKEPESPVMGDGSVRPIRAGIGG
jgi:hypothetical protein